MSSRADIRAGRSVKRTVTMAPKKPASKKISRFSLLFSVCTLFWFAIAAMFAGLFGWAYTHWDACKGQALYVTNTTSCLELGDDGVFANANGCANECDAQLHKSHTDAGRYLGNSGRRLQNSNPAFLQAFSTTPLDVIDFFFQDTGIDSILR